LSRRAFVILAAGTGSRMGGVTKGLIRVNGDTLLHRLHRVAQSVSHCDTFIVTGQANAHVVAEVERWTDVTRATIIPINASGQEPSASLQQALEAIAKLSVYEMFFIALADQPLLDASDLSSLLEAFQSQSPAHRLLVPCFKGQPGHPLVMEGSLARDLLTEADTSLRQWRKSHPDQVVQWPMGNDHCVRDLDTTEDLERLHQETGWDCQLPSAV